MGSALGNVFRWLAGIIAAFDRPAERRSQQAHPASDIAVESRACSAEAEGVTAERSATELTSVVLHTDPVVVDDGFASDVRVNRVAALPDGQEIQRRRDLVRALFNDFWSGYDNKPASFVDRLDQAERYLNERLIACGESWTLDAATRKLLGLPPSLNSPDGGKGRI